MHGAEYELEGLRKASAPLSFDFGSAVTFIPRAAYESFMKFLVVDESITEGVGPLYLPSCLINPTPPVFRVKINLKYVLELSAEEYVFRDDKGGCTIGIQPNDAGVWKVGALVAKRYAIIIDNGMVGNHADNRVSYLAFSLEHGKRKTHVPKLSIERPSASKELLSNEPEQMQEDESNVVTTPRI